MRFLFFFAFFAPLREAIFLFNLRNLRNLRMILILMRNRLLTRENLLAVLLCLLAVLLLILATDSAPQWIYQGF